MPGRRRAHKVLLVQNARAVDEHIRQALATLERGRELLRRTRRSQISRQNQHLAVMLGFKKLCQRLQLVGAAGNQHEVVAYACEAVGQRFADAGRGAGD